MHAAGNCGKLDEMQFIYVGTICIGFRDDRGFLNLIYCFPVHFIFITLILNAWGKMTLSTYIVSRDPAQKSYNCKHQPAWPSTALRKLPAFMVLVQLYCCTQFHDPLPVDILTFTTILKLFENFLTYVVPSTLPWPPIVTVFQFWSSSKTSWLYVRCSALHA